MFASIEPNGVRWENGSFQEADAIIWSTGFRPELRHLSPLKLREKEGGIVVANGTAWKDGRIFFAGYGPQASTIGAQRAGRTIARQAVATLSRLKREARDLADAEAPPVFVYHAPAPEPAAESPAPTELDYFGDGDARDSVVPTVDESTPEEPAAEPLEETAAIILDDDDWMKPQN